MLETEQEQTKEKEREQEQVRMKERLASYEDRLRTWLFGTQCKFQLQFIITGNKSACHSVVSRFICLVITLTFDLENLSAVSTLV